jgi:hypothetical protein
MEVGKSETDRLPVSREVPTLLRIAGLAFSSNAKVISQVPQQESGDNATFLSFEERVSRAMN